MPSQAQTFAKHKAEKASRKRARDKAHRAKERQRRLDSTATQANAAAGSKAHKLIEDRRAKRAAARQLIDDLRQSRAQARADVALRNQRQHDKDVQDMKTKARDDATKAVTNANNDAQKKANDANDAKNDKLVTQPKKEKGTLAGKVIGAIDIDRINGVIVAIQDARGFVEILMTYGSSPPSDWYTELPLLKADLDYALDHMSDEFVKTFQIRQSKEENNG